MHLNWKRPCSPSRVGMRITPRLGTSESNIDSASVGATPEPSPSFMVRGTPTKAMPSMPVSLRIVSRSRSVGSSRNAVTCVHSPLTPGSSGLMIDQKSSTSIFGFISRGRSPSSSIMPGIITWRIRPASPASSELLSTFWASSKACSRPRSTFGGTSSSAMVLRLNGLLLIELIGGCGQPTTVSTTAKNQAPQRAELTYRSCSAYWRWSRPCSTVTGGLGHQLDTRGDTEFGVDVRQVCLHRAR